MNKKRVLICNPIKDTSVPSINSNMLLCVCVGVVYL